MVTVAVGVLATRRGGTYGLAVGVAVAVAVCVCVAVEVEVAVAVGVGVFARMYADSLGPYSVLA